MFCACASCSPVARSLHYSELLFRARGRIIYLAHTSPVIVHLQKTQPRGLRISEQLCPPTPQKKHNLYDHCISENVYLVLMTILKMCVTGYTIRIVWLQHFNTKTKKNCHLFTPKWCLLVYCYIIVPFEIILPL